MKASVGRWFAGRWRNLKASKVRLIGIPFGLLMMALMFLGIQEDLTYLLMRITGLILVFHVLADRRL